MHKYISNLLVVFSMFFVVSLYAQESSPFDQWVNSLQQAKTQRGMTARAANADFPYENLRIIGEVTTPLNDKEEDNQWEELEYFKGLGYNGAFVVWRGEDPKKLEQITKKLKEDGWVILFVHTRSWKDKPMFLQDFSVGLPLLVPYADMALTGWHNTSLPGKEDFVTKVLMYEMLKIKSDLFILGETFVYPNGTALNSELEDSSVNLLENVGYATVSLSKVFGCLDKSKRYVPVVVGPVASYRTKLSPVPDPSYVVREVCHKIENVFLANPIFPVTLTIAGGGKGTQKIRSGQYSDSLTKTGWRNNLYINGEN